MIKLSKEGQWFKFFQEYDYYPTNLCQLFWTALLLPLGLTLIGLVASFVAVIVLLGWYHLVGLFFGVLWPWGGLGISVGVFVLLQMAIVLYWSGKLVKSNVAGTPVPATLTKAGDVIITGYHGFKEKFCPLVEWE